MVFAIAAAGCAMELSDSAGTGPEGASIHAEVECGMYGRAPGSNRPPALEDVLAGARYIADADGSMRLSALRVLSAYVRPEELPTEATWSRADPWIVVTHPSGSIVWTFYQGDTVATEYCVAPDALRPGERLVPMLDVDWDAGALALGPDGFRELEPDAAGSPEHPLVERAPASSTNELDEETARGATVAVRYLKACPTSLRECLLYGPLSDVVAAVNPLEPPGGWNLLPAAPSWDPASFRVDGRVGYPLSGPESAEVEWMNLPDDEGSPVAVRVWIVRADRRVPAFDYEVWDRPIPGFDTNIELVRDGDRLVLTAWSPDTGVGAVSEHDARTLERIGAPLVVRAEPYHDLGCDAGLWSMRPTPVRTARGLRMALHDGGARAWYFEQPGQFGAEVRVTEEGHHAMFEVAADGSLRPARGSRPVVLDVYTDSLSYADE